MDNININDIHRVLLDVSLPSTIKDLKNPTEEYVVNLLTTFLSRFNINLSLIDQPIPEQLTVMTYYEDSDVINLINLHAVMTRIFEKIFVHDFCLPDITNPGQKRFKKQAKFLSNFVLYAMHKKLKFNDRMDQIQNMSKLQEELKERKAQLSESINNTIKHKAKQLCIIEKLNYDIQHIESNMEKINKKELEFQTMKNDVERENQKAKELYGSVKTAAGKLSKNIIKVQSEVVSSPEEYHSRLDEVEKQYKLKIEKRGEMQEAIQGKRHSIKQIEEKLNFVQKLTGDFCTVEDVYKEQGSKKIELSNIKNEIDLLNNIWDKSKTKWTMHKDQMDIEKNKLQTYYEEDIVPLSNLYHQLLSEKKIQKTKLDKDQECFNEKCLEKNKLQANIKKREEETEAFINNCQVTYDEEIANELKLRNVCKEK